MIICGIELAASEARLVLLDGASKNYTHIILSDYRLPAHVLHVLCSLAMAGRCHCKTRPPCKHTCLTFESVAGR